MYFFKRCVVCEMHASAFPARPSSGSLGVLLIRNISSGTEKASAARKQFGTIFQRAKRRMDPAKKMRNRWLKARRDKLEI